MTPRRLIEPARLAGTSMLRTQSDARLVDLARAGHSAAFEAIVERYRKPLLGYCSRLLPASRADDAVQQTFLNAYQAMVSSDAHLNLRPWLYRIAHNASLNLLRQNGWSHEQLDENLDGVQRPDQALELRERLRATVTAVKDLPERQRDAILLREIEGLSYEEIALVLGVGDGAVRQLLHRARAALRAGASAVTPVGLLERFAAALAGGGGDPATRVGELAAGMGAGAGAVKIGAAVLATGAIATGALSVPLRHHSGHDPTRQTAEASMTPSAAAADKPSEHSSVPVTDPQPAPNGTHSHHGASGDDNSGGRSGPGPSSGSPSGGHRSPSSGGDDHPSGSGDDNVEHHSGSGGDDHHRGSSDRSGGGSNNTSGSGGDRGTSGSGSDDGGHLSFSGDGGDDGHDGSAPSGSTGDGGGSGSGDGGGSGDQTVTSPTGTTGQYSPVSGGDSSGKSGDG